MNIKLLSQQDVDSSYQLHYRLDADVYISYYKRQQAQLERIMSANGLSENVYEIASKSLAA